MGEDLTKDGIRDMLDRNVPEEMSEGGYRIPLGRNPMNPEELVKPENPKEWVKPEKPRAEAVTEQDEPEYMDAQFRQLPANWMDKLKGCVTGTAVPLVAYLFFWRWMLSGQMDLTPAVLCISLCAFAIGLNLFKAIKK